MSAYSDLILASSPVGYWRLNETSGTTATDLSGGGLHGTYSGTATLNQNALIMTDASARSVDFITNGKAVLAGGLCAALHGASAITAELWMYIDSAAAPSTPFAISTGTNVGLYAYIYTSTQITVAGRSVATDTLQSKTATVTSVAGRLVHLVCICDYANDKLYTYLNGVKILDEAVTFANTTFTYGAGTDVNTLACGISSTDFIDGRLADYAVYASGLSEATILAHYQMNLAPPERFRACNTVSGYYSVRHLGI